MAPAMLYAFVSLLLLASACQAFELHQPLPRMHAARASSVHAARASSVLTRARVLASDPYDNYQPGDPPRGKKRKSDNQGLSLGSVLTAIPYAIGLLAFTALYASQAGYLDDFEFNFGGLFDFEIPAEWLLDEPLPVRR